MSQNASPKRFVVTTTILFFLALALLVVTCKACCGKIHEDLTPLTAFRAQHGYAAAIKAIQSQPITPEGFTFVVLGDTRSNFDEAREILAQAARENPRFILHTGDLILPPTVDQYLAYHIPLMESVAPIPVIPVPGNHENGPNRDFAGFIAAYGADHFAFDYGGCRFAGINTGDRTRLGFKDLRFLHQELEKPGAQHKFVFSHIPPNFMKSAGGRGLKWNTSPLQNLLEHTGVEYVFSAHIHGYALERRGSVRYIITGGGGAPLTDTLGENGNVRNYLVFTVTPESCQGVVVRKVGDQWTRSPLE